MAIREEKTSTNNVQYGLKNNNEIHARINPFFKNRSRNIKFMFLNCTSYFSWPTQRRADDERGCKIWGEWKEIMLMMINTVCEYKSANDKCNMYRGVFFAKRLIGDLSFNLRGIGTCSF